MKEFKGTPGAWCSEVTSVWAKHTYVAEVMCLGESDDTQMANARLIASAPELLQSLQECMEHMIWMSDEAKQCYARAEAVIAKALGK